MGAYPETPTRPSELELDALLERLLGPAGAVESVRMLTKAVVFAWDVVRAAGLGWGDVVQPPVPA